MGNLLLKNIHKDKTLLVIGKKKIMKIAKFEDESYGNTPFPDGFQGTHEKH